MRLNLGCGPVWLKGYINCDIDTPQEICARAVRAGLEEPHQTHDTAFTQMDLLQPWPWPDGVVTEILADNFLEHFDHYGLNHLLAESRRVMAPGAAVSGHVPDIERIVAYAVAKSGWAWEPAWALGGPYETTAYNALQNMAHCWGHHQVFTQGMLAERLRIAGFLTDVVPVGQHQLYFVATKPTED